MTRSLLLPSLAFACTPLLTACPGDDTQGTEEVGDTSSSTGSESDTDPTTSDTDPTTTSETDTDPTTTTETTTDPTTTTETTTDPTTTTESTTDPTTDTGGTCGDAIIDADEACDGFDLGGADCFTLGFAGGELLCAGDCKGYDTSGCFGGGTCGDGIWEGDEDCDGADIFGTCMDFGYPGGQLGCTANCTFDFSGCNDCGNDVIDAGEVCDGSDLDGQTCNGLGFMYGELACSETCDALLEAACSNVLSWSEDFEGGAALPAEWSVGGDAPWFGSAATVHAGMFAGESGNIADDQTSFMEVTRNFVSPGTVRFWYRTSSEEGWDYLRFYVDGMQQVEWSGDIPWTQSPQYAVPAGNHTLRWEYAKDGSLDDFLDTVWVDDIVTTNSP